MKPILNWGDFMDTIIELNGETYDLADIKYIQKTEAQKYNNYGNMYYTYGIKLHFVNVKPTMIWFSTESMRDQAFSMLIKIMNKVKAKRGY